MKRLASLLALSLLFAPALASLASAQTADAVVEKYLAALGGRDALGKLTSRRSTGTVTVSTQGADISGPIEISMKAPNKTRAFMTLDLTALGGTDMTVEQLFNGTVGVTLNSLQGDTDITGNQLENMRNSTFPTPLLNYKDAGVKVELLPSEKIDGADVLVLLVTPKTGSAVRMFFDAQTSLLVRTVSTVNSPEIGGDLVQTSNYSDYRAVDGVKVPFHVVNSNAIQTVAITLSKVEHNVPMDDALFVKK